MDQLFTARKEERDHQEIGGKIKWRHGGKSEQIRRRKGKKHQGGEQLEMKIVSSFTAG